MPCKWPVIWHIVAPAIFTTLSPIATLLDGSSDVKYVVTCFSKCSLWNQIYTHTPIPKHTLPQHFFVVPPLHRDNLWPHVPQPVDFLQHHHSVWESCKIMSEEDLRSAFHSSTMLHACCSSCLFQTFRPSCFFSFFPFWKMSIKALLQLQN